MTSDRTTCGLPRLMDLIIINTTWPIEDENSIIFWSLIMNTTINVHLNVTVDDNNSDSVYDVPTLILVLLSILYGTISVLAVLGNSLVIWIIVTSKRMHNVTNYYIANLALADIVIGLFAIPFQFQAALLQRWNLPHFMCAFCPFVQILSVNVSVFTLTAIAIDRHRAILKPLSVRPSKLTAKIVIAGIWLVAMVLATPMAVARRVIMVPDIDKLKPFCQAVNLSSRTMLIYSMLLAFLQYLTPLSIIFCVYTRMALKLWGNRAPGNAEDFRDANFMRNKIRVIKMLIIVVVLFTVCWLPLQTYNVLQYFYPEINEYKYIHYIFFFSDWLAMSNSCYNPFIYGIYNENFRREFQGRCSCKSRRWSGGPSNDTTDAPSTKCSVRYEWKRSTSSSYPSVSSLYKGTSMKGSFVNGRKSNDRNKNKGLGHYIRRGNHCSNGSEELYVLPSGKHKRSENFGSEEMGL